MWDGWPTGYPLLFFVSWLSDGLVFSVKKLKVSSKLEQNQYDITQVALA